MTPGINFVKENKFFCVAPWVHQYVGPPGDVKPCCVYEHDKSIGNLKKEESLVKIWNNEETKKLRLDFLNNIRREECNWCNDRITPFRNSFNDIYYNKSKEIQEIVASTEADGSVKDHKLFYMDVRFNNLCNFRCRTCGPHFSTSIAMEEKILRPNANVGMTYPGTHEDHIFEEMLPHLPYLIEVYFAGGEPMMQKEHYQVLERLVEIGNVDITIKYNTNFSKLKLGRWDVIQYWKHFSNVIINASLDGHGPKAEYWRKGTVWSEIIANRRRMMDECPKVKFMLSPTVSWINAINVLDFHKIWTEQGLIGIDDIILNELNTPIWFCLKNIPDFKKDKIAFAFEEHINWLIKNNASELTIFKFKAAQGFMRSEIRKVEFPANEFYSLISQFDILRKENFFEVFDEHADMKDYIEKLGYNFNYGNR